MELILISESKLKVMLSADDMKLYNITCETIDYDDRLSRRAFWDILSEARVKTGFDASGEKVYVQVYPSKTGGCEMFVTKIPSDTDVGSERNDRSRRTAQGNCIYRFDSMNDLLESCHAMKSGGFSGRSNAYADRAKRLYYLVTERESNLPGEYFAKKCKPGFVFYINEYCKHLCDDAVNILGEL